MHTILKISTLPGAGCFFSTSLYRAAVVVGEQHLYKPHVPVVLSYTEEQQSSLVMHHEAQCSLDFTETLAIKFFFEGILLFFFHFIHLCLD